MATNEDVQAKLEDLRAKRAKRESEREAEAQARELQELELEDKYSTDLGPRGKAFEMVVTEHGIVVVKLGDAATYKRYMASDKDAAESIHQFVAPNVVFPSREEYGRLTVERPFVGVKCAGALLSLYGVKEDARAKK